MKIAQDAKRMLNNGTGLGNHARILANALMRDFPEYEYQLYTPRIDGRYLHELQGVFSLHLPEGKLAQALHPWWRSYGITADLQRNRVDIYHGLSNELPLNIHRSGIPSVVTIHDLIFLKHKEQYPWLDRQIYELKTIYAVKHADKIIAVSEETKEDLVKFYNTPDKKIEVVYQSIDVRFYKKGSAERVDSFKRKYALPDNFVLNVSSFFPRKNQLKLIEAFALIKDKTQYDLVLAGGAGGMLPAVKDAIVQAGLTNRVQILTGISNDEIPLLYQSAGLFVYPALMEGFGMPVLEAIVSGVPVIATRGGAIEEAAGQGSLLIDPEDTADMARNVLSVLNDASLREQMIQAGYHHARKMTDTTFAAKVTRVYESIV